MARNQKHYDTDYKVQSVNLAKEIGLSKAARDWYFYKYFKRLDKSHS